MATTRFYGEVGYGESVETAPGVWEEDMTEVPYFGDVLRNTRRLESDGDSVIDDILVNNSISIVADDKAIKSFFNIKYVNWMGTSWTVSSVEVRGPRLILSLGKVYNGPKPT
jgi:hypothetical protein